MSPLTLYFLKASLLLVVFFAFYKLVLHKETWYRFNRFYLLFSLLLTAFLPFLEIPVSAKTLPAVSLVLGEISVTDKAVPEAPVSLSLDMVFQWIYLGVCGIFLLRLGVQIFQIWRLKIRSEVKDPEEQNIFIHPDLPSSFSFLSWIFLDRKSLNTNRWPIILRHEQAHIRQWHSLDLILAEVFKAVFWFHPLAWILHKSMQEIHEYLADREVLRAGTHASEYMGVLMQQIDLSRPVPMSNHFNQSLLKRRFTMISKPKSGSVPALRAGLFMPLLTLSCIFILYSLQNTGQAQESKKSLPAQKTEKALKPVKTEKSQDEVFQVVDEMPVYADGQEAMLKYIGGNVQYPEIAKKNGIEATIYVNFVVKNNGELSQAKVLKAVDKPGKGDKKVKEADLKAALDAMSREALRVVSSLPGKWTPGKQNGKAVNVAFTLPIKFALN